MYKIGFIGCGNMAKAMIGGIIAKKSALPEEIIASRRNHEALKEVKEAFGICTTVSNIEAAKDSELVVLAVKPYMYETVINEIKEYITDSQIIITIAPGKSLEWLKAQFGFDVKIVRTMPNTPALVGEGMTAVVPNEFVANDDLEKVMFFLDSFGKSELVTESVMSAVTAVSGSSPAYVFMFIEAMADAAVAEGMARDTAYKFAAQAVLGSAKMVLDTGKHPGELKDMVCSPGGTTIQAVRVLEEKGLRCSVIEAMTACAEKANSI